MRALWALLIPLAACGPKPKFPSDDRADREVIDCPTGPALDRAADAAWDTASLGDMTEHAVTCVPLYNHEPLWLLDGTVMNDSVVVVGTALTTTKNERRWSNVESMDSTRFADLVHEGWTAVDLDGDAHDELIEVAGKVVAEEGETETWLVPYAILDGKAVAGPRLALSSSPVSCTSTFEIVTAPRGRHLIKIDSSPGCEVPGVHTYGWQVNQLVEE